MLERLSALWQSNPDMRLGQIIVNAARELQHSDAYYLEDSSLYYLEDASLLDGIELLARRIEVGA
jgi:hypothetical protein